MNVIRISQPCHFLRDVSARRHWLTSLITPHNYGTRAQPRTSVVAAQSPTLEPQPYINRAQRDSLCFSRRALFLAHLELARTMAETAEQVNFHSGPALAC